MSVPPIDSFALNPNFATRLWATATAVPEREAIVGRDARTTYAELAARAGSCWQALAAAGVVPGDRVAIFLERGPSAAAAFFGALAAGAVVTNVNETLRPRQIEYILGHAETRALLTTADILGRLPRALELRGTVLIDIARMRPAPADSLDAPAVRVGSDVALIIYTSGSTGLPKGVTLSHANLWAGMRAVCTYLGIRAEDRIASLLPFSFDYGLNQLLCTVGTGATLVVERSAVPQRIVATLDEMRVSVLPAVPPLWLQLLEVERFRAPLPALRLMTNTGGRLPAHAVRALRSAHRDARLFLMYGLTEAFRSTYLPPEEVDRRPDSVGRAIPGAQILVLREDGTECAPGEVGELVHRGPTVALGYWKEPEATARVFRPNPLPISGAPDAERVVFSGDLVRRDAQGFLSYVGRRDKLLKTLGYRVSPDEIADALYASGQVVEAVATPEPDDQLGDRIVAWVVLTPGGSIDRLRQFCKTELPRYMQPARYEVRGALPRTASGKHDPQALARCP